MGGDYLQATAQFFPNGTDSNTNPEYLSDTQFFNSMNCVFRGGMPQTRPGYNTVFGLPCGQPQGMTIFKPTGSPPYIVAAIAGFIYASKFPFTEYTQLGNIQFSERAKRVVFQSTVQTTDYDFDGNLIQLDRPKNILMMQDGCSRASSWDGGQIQKLNPAPSNQEFTKEGFDETVIGTWTAWAGNRYWVSRGNEVFASDYGNPLKFTETQYLSEGRAFYMQEEVTGMGVPGPSEDRSPLIVFGANTNTQLRADIQDRTLWLSTPQFQTEDDNVGCVAGKSVTKKNGELWWYSLSGWVNYNTAMRIRSSGQFSLMDNQMGISKQNISPTTDTICAGAFENYLLVSVPSGDLWNRHTWVMDKQPVSGGDASWNGYWTGTRPAEWATDEIEGQERIFCLSHDYDGVNRIWEAFDPSREDNGCPITCMAETKQHNMGGNGWKKYKYTKIHLDEVHGDLDFAAYFAGKKGGYTKILDKRMVSTVGPFTEDREYCAAEDTYQSYKPQTRVIKTKSAERVPNDCNRCGVESNLPNHTDTSFSNLFVWSGRAAVRMYQMIAHDANEEVEDFQGKCEENETGIKILSLEGCSSTTDEDSIGSAFSLIEDAETVTIDCLDPIGSDPTIGVGLGSSYISALDAQKKAACNAFLDAYESIDCGKCSPPVIDEDINGGELCIPANLEVTLEVSASSCDGRPLEYQWYEGESGDISTPILGQTNSSYTVVPALGEKFWVRVSSSCGGGSVDSSFVEVCSQHGEIIAKFGVENNQTSSPSGIISKFGIEPQSDTFISGTIVKFGVIE